MGNAGVSGSDSGRLTDHLSIGVLTRTVPRYVIDEVLASTGRKEKRSRLLPAHVVVYFVMSLALFRDGYDEVMRQLVHGLRFARTWSRAWQVPTTSAMSQARVRLGEAPMRELFTRVAVPLATAGTPGAWLGRWRLMAIDGVMLDIAETDANVAVYEKSDGGTRRPYPQVKIVGLGEAGTHAILDAQIGSIRHGERELAEPLTSSVTPDMLVLADRGFFSYPLWRSYLLTGAALLWRISKTTHLPVLQVLPDGSYLSEIKSFKGPGKTRIALDRVADSMLATHIPVRVIEYQVHPGDGATEPETYRLITTILDPAEADAHTLAAAYTQRWEFESSLREVECQLLEPGSTLRSKNPETVRQEIWALLLAHYAIRAFMAEAADTVDLDPDRLSTIRAINVVRRSVTDLAAFSPRRTTAAAEPGDQ
jgi:hypothetical protein